MAIYYVLPHYEDTGKDIMGVDTIDNLLIQAYRAAIDFNDYKPIQVFETPIHDYKAFIRYYYGNDKEHAYLRANSNCYGVEDLSC